MKKIILGILIILVSIAVSDLFETLAYAQEEMAPVPVPMLKRRVAVFNFEDKTDYGKFNVGEGMADMLTTDLVKSNKYIVFERQQMEKVMQEQQMGLTGAVTQQTAAQVGKLLGVELAVFGAVTEFGQKESKTGGALKKQNFGIGLNKSQARVAIDVRIVDTETGQIMAAESVIGEEKKTGLALETHDISFNNRSQFDQTQVGKATRKAIDQIIAKIDVQLSHKPWSGKVIKAGDQGVFINGGSNIGLLVGNMLQVFRPGEELIDPETGLSLGSEEKKIGDVQIFDVQEKFSKAMPRSGSGFAAGDVVRP